METKSPAELRTMRLLRGMTLSEVCVAAGISWHALRWPARAAGTPAPRASLREPLARLSVDIGRELPRACTGQKASRPGQVHGRAEPPGLVDHE
jgi:hypothetical protein